MRPSRNMRRLQKPIRLYVLTIFVVMAYGLMPFIATMPFGKGFLLFGLWNLPFNGSVYVLYGSDGEAPFLLLLVSLFLCAFSAFSSVVAFYGSSAARIATPVLVSLDVLWWTALVITTLVNGELSNSQMIPQAIEPLTSLLWLCCIWWNY